MEKIHNILYRTKRFIKKLEIFKEDMGWEKLVKKSGCKRTIKEHKDCYGTTQSFEFKCDNYPFRVFEFFDNGTICVNSQIIIENLSEYSMWLIIKALIQQNKELAKYQKGIRVYNEKYYLRPMREALKGKTPEQIDNFWNIQVKSLFQTSNVSLANTWEAEEELFKKEKEKNS